MASGAKSAVESRDALKQSEVDEPVIIVTRLLPMMIKRLRRRMKKRRKRQLSPSFSFRRICYGTLVILEIQVNFSKIITFNVRHVQVSPDKNMDI